MTAAELKSIAMRVCGEHDWKALLAEKIGVHPQTVRRWTRGSPIPEPSAMAIRSLERQS